MEVLGRLRSGLAQCVICRRCDRVLLQACTDRLGCCRGQATAGYDTVTGGTHQQLPGAASALPERGEPLDCRALIQRVKSGVHS